MAASEAPRKGVSRGTTMLFTPIWGVHGAALTHASLTHASRVNPSVLSASVLAPGDVPLCYLLELDGVCVLLGACASA